MPKVKVELRTNLSAVFEEAKENLDFLPDQRSPS